MDIKRIRSAVIDGRARAPRFKQQQLTNLHAALDAAATKFVTAIRKETGILESEAHIEFYLTMKAIKDFYTSLDFETMLKEEYKIAKSESNLSRREPFGCAYIIPSAHHSNLYSVVVPVAAAIASGNCVLLEIKQTLSSLDALLREVLTATLDTETFAITDGKEVDSGFREIYCITLDVKSEQTTAENSNIRYLRTPSSLRVAAVVDKTANFDEAAKALVRARFSFEGRSPYAPDVVLVNEFCIKDFAQAIARNATAFIAGNIDGTMQKPPSDTASRRRPKTGNNDLQKQITQSGCTTLASGSRGSVVLVDSRDSELLRTKISEPVLLIHAMSSMDDGIDFLNSTSRQKNTATPLLASYLFAAPPAAKYLSQFIDANLSYTNDIPIELLVGPAAPMSSSSSFPPCIQPRYSSDMFSVPRPEFIGTDVQSKLLSDIVDGKVDAKTLKTRLNVGLSPMNEPLGGGIGFFEQGLLTGGSLALSAIACCAVLGVRYLLPVIMTRLR